MAIKVIRSENTRAFLEDINAAAAKHGIIFQSLEGRLVDLETGSSEFIYITRKLNKIPSETPIKPKAETISFNDRKKVLSDY